MATASVLCPAQEHHGSQRPAVNLGRAANYAWRLLLQPLRRKACFVASVADARRLSMASRSLAVPPCFNAGVNRISRCSAALLCSHRLSSASAFATPARRNVLAMLLCWRQPHLALQCCTSVQSLAKVSSASAFAVFARCDCATCFYAGINRISFCGAALLCSHWLSLASALFRRVARLMWR